MMGVGEEGRGRVGVQVKMGEAKVNYDDWIDSYVRGGGVAVLAHAVSVCPSPCAFAFVVWSH